MDSVHKKIEKVSILFKKDKKNEDHATPKSVLDDIRSQHGEFFDPCPLNGRAAAELDATKNGLIIDWAKVNYCNPPFHETEKWAYKAVLEKLKGNKTIFLCVARLNSNYWRDVILPHAASVKFFHGRLRFIEDSPGLPLPIALIIFDPTVLQSRVHLEQIGGYNCWEFYPVGIQTRT